MRPILVVSPHLDDAVLSCGQLLAANPGSVVLTVFSFNVLKGYRLTSWDRLCGLKRVVDVPRLRRGEDAVALAGLGCSPRHYYSDQHTDPGDLLWLISDAWRLVAQMHGNYPRTILIPMGMGHPDHDVVFRRALEAKARMPKHLRWIVYEEPVRRLIHTKEMKARIRKYKMRPIRLRVGALERKRQAVAAYASQVVGLKKEWGEQFDTDVFAPERYWRLP